jgi:hypothetical protein
MFVVYLPTSFGISGLSSFKAFPRTVVFELPLPASVLSLSVPVPVASFALSASASSSALSIHPSRTWLPFSLPV